jgi:hypothetical protein
MDDDMGSRGGPYVSAFTERDCEQFRELALLHRDAKALILYSEEIDTRFPVKSSDDKRAQGRARSPDACHAGTIGARRRLRRCRRRVL